MTDRNINRTTAPIRLTDGKHFNYTTRLGDKTIDFMRPIHDPFLSCTLETKLGGLDKLRVLLGKPITHTVIVSAEPDVVSAVTRLARAGDGEIVLEPLSETGPGGLAEFDGFPRTEGRLDE